MQCVFELHFVESDLKRLSKTSRVSKTEAPRYAYLISGINGDSQRMMRTLQAIYHPRNQYILHMDLEALPHEMLDFTTSVKKDPMFRKIDNVYVMEKSNMVTYRGPTMIATTLQAIAILLKCKMGLVYKPQRFRLSSYDTGWSL